MHKTPSFTPKSGNDNPQRNNVLLEKLRLNLSNVTG